MSKFTAHFEYIKRRALRPDVRYQRTKLRHAKIQEIAEQFDPDYFGTLHVAPSGGDNRYAVIDGWHRVCAIDILARSQPEWGPECELPCMVHETQEAARTFIGLNNNSPLTALEKLKARYAAQEPTVLELVRLVRDQNCEFAFDTNRNFTRSNMVLTSVKAVEDMYNEDAKLLEWTLSCALQAWPGDQNALKGSLLRGLFTFATYASIDGYTVDTQRLISALTRVSPETIRRRGIQEYTEAVASGIAMAVLEVYNKEARQGRIRPWTRTHLVSLRSMKGSATRRDEMGEQAYREHLVTQLNAPTPEERSARARKSAKTRREQAAAAAAASTSADADSGADLPSLAS